MVTPEAPVNAVKIAQDINVTMANPPGIQPKKARDRLTNLLGVLLSANKYPAKVNKGMANKTG